MYNPKSIEPKWQKFWQEHKTFKTLNPSSEADFNKPKYYTLDMFPYPSGEGLHVGHPKGFIASDIVSRYKHNKGFRTLHTMGWDSFGLPAENYAIKTGIHPRIKTAENIANYKRQLQMIGFSYDWDRELATTDPAYYKWTQWIFLKLFEQGLAYEQDLPINYCPSCKTGLANEEVVGDNNCDRCGNKVERRKIRQWVLAITKYAERLFQDVDGLDWPEGIKDMQRNWIGKSEGVEFRMYRDISEHLMGNRCILDCQEEAHIDRNHRLRWQLVRAKFLACRDISETGDFYAEIVPEIANLGNDFDYELEYNKLRTKYYFSLDDNLSISVYTTRIDTVYGMTYVVLAADHKDVNNWITPEQRDACEKYIADSKAKSDLERTNEGKEKTGEFTGSYVVNPFNGEQIPVWIGDYVLGSYGTGAVMAVPAHDERDFEFAKKMGLLIKQSIAPNINLKGEGAIREGVETIRRSTVSAVVEYKGKYLCLQRGVDTFLIGGGIEQGETSEEAIRREIIEETGYKNFVIEGTILEKLYARGYHATKQKNQEVNDIFYHIRLLNDENIGISEEENLKHIPKWFSPDDVSKKITWEHHMLVWKMFITNAVYIEDGILFNSAEFTGLTSAEAREKLAQKAESEGFGKKKINYKLRDWLFSRQRYWGEPIPLIHLAMEDVRQLPHISDISEATDASLAYILKRDEIDGECSTGATCGGKVRELVIGGKVVSKIYDGLYGKIICDYKLPLELPEVANYEPAGDGNSPLAVVPSFVNITLASNLVGKRETNTMPQWAGSCWYYLRFMDTTNDQFLVDPKLAKYWGEVDSYVGGAEHAVLHLLYARFWHKFLFDIGVVPNSEPFRQLHNQGMILAYAYERDTGGLVALDLVEEKDGKYFEKSTGKEVKQIVAKMSKSLKNVVNPDAVINEHGTDTFRLYEMYMSDFKDSAPWNTDAIIGVRRFLDKSVALFETPKFATDDMKAMKLLHKTIKKVGEDIEAFKFNTAIAALMILVNEGLPKDAEYAEEWKKTFAILLHPFAPHLAEELWGIIQMTPISTWPDKMLNEMIFNGGYAAENSVYNAAWPEYQDFMLVDDEVTIAIQINGKLRGTHTFLNGVSQEEVAARVMEDPDINKWLDGLTVVREIFVPNKLYGIVAK